MKKTLLIVFVLAAASLMVSAHGNNFDEAEEIIKSRASCSQLTDEQLELIGDYYMEQMHPGEAHEVMDEMMGGEGSESLRQMHIKLARAFYCGEQSAMSPGVMDVMMGRGNGAMGSSGLENREGMMGIMSGYGMMSWPTDRGFGWLWMIVWLALWIGIIWLVVWLIRKPAGKKKMSALETLKRLYAKGEITKKQFAQIKKEMRGR
jgi:uncharacterized membrane protein